MISSYTPENRLFSHHGTLGPWSLRSAVACGARPHERDANLIEAERCMI